MGGDHGHGKHDDHGHGDHGHEDGHHGDNHGHGSSKYPYTPHARLHVNDPTLVQQRAPSHAGHMPDPEPVVVASLPSMASRQYISNMTAWEPEVDMPPPRTFWERWTDPLFNWLNDGERPYISEPLHAKPVTTVYEWAFKSMFPLKPETYSDPYWTPNKCPEEFWALPWKWPLHKMVSPKVPPPLNGRYNDFLHYHAFKLWIHMERDVYVAHLGILQEMMLRCSLKEGVNAPKNCRHLWNKYFSMSRHEEFTQCLLYMAFTGNTVMRETPYPADFVDTKRKIYDDWLTRTRMRRPGDMY